MSLDTSWWSEIIAQQSHILAPIKSFLVSELKQHTIYPPMKNLFEAFELCPRDDLTVVILWQDPYHNPGQAHGLSFSVPEWITHPPSLDNIFASIKHDYPHAHFDTSDLSCRARQWVLLLNSFLSVQAHKPLSHAKIWREKFTDQIITHISYHKDHVVFLLRWAFAQSKSILIDTTKHFVLKAPHPSPLSAHRGFMDCGHFVQTNTQLKIWWYADIDRSTKIDPVKHRTD